LIRYKERFRPATVEHHVRRLQCKSARRVKSGYFGCTVQEDGMIGRPAVNAASREALIMIPALPIGRAVALASALTLLLACSDTSASLDRKMSEIRREQCDPLPNEVQRMKCIRQVNDIEDNTLRRLDQARQQQVIQQTVDQMHVINQSGQGW
jgi:hypothetical protein